MDHDWLARPLPPGVVIGARSWLYSSFAFIHHASRRPQSVRIGSDSGIYSATSFALGPQGEVQIGDFCTIVAAVFCTNRRVVIEDYALISHSVVIADDLAAVPPALTDGGRFATGLGAEQADPAPPPISVRVGENVWIGARAVLLGGAEIGDGAIVGAATVVDFAVPPFAVVAGDPARIVGWARPQRSDGGR